MKISGDLTFKYKSADDAKVVFDSLEVDNENYLKSRLNNEKFYINKKNIYKINIY